LTSKSRWSQLEVGLCGQFSPSVWPHNPATGFRPPSATVISAELFSHGTGTLRCLQKEMATYRHWSVSLWRGPDDVSHCRILTKLNGGLSRLHSADEDAISWRTSYGSWHAYEKKKIGQTIILRRLESVFQLLFCLKFLFKLVCFSHSYAGKQKWAFFLNTHQCSTRNQTWRKT